MGKVLPARWTRTSTLGPIRSNAAFSALAAPASGREIRRKRMRPALNRKRKQRGTSPTKRTTTLSQLGISGKRDNRLAIILTDRLRNSSLEGSGNSVHFGNTRPGSDAREGLHYQAVHRKSLPGR